jgi:organic radical activating enzyme
LCPLQKEPVPVFDVHTVCNQIYAYRALGASQRNDHGPIADPDLIKKVKMFYNTHGPSNILFTGGNPLVTRWISDLFRFLVDKDHPILSQTNLKYGLDLFTRGVPPTLAVAKIKK